MQKMTDRQRYLFGEKALDLANIAAGALIFGQFLSGSEISWRLLAIVGAVVYLILITFAFSLTRD